MVYVNGRYVKPRNVQDEIKKEKEQKRQETTLGGGTKKPLRAIDPAREELRKKQLAQDPLFSEKVRILEERQQAQVTQQAQTELIPQSQKEKVEAITQAPKVELSPQGDSEIQQKFETGLPILGSSAAALGTAYADKTLNPSQRFGALIEATPILGGLVSWAKAGNLVNTPGSSAKSLASQVPQVKSDIRNMIRNTADPAEALIGLNEIEADLSVLQSQIAQNVATSAELRANPEDVDLIEAKINTVNSLIFYYRREIISDPNNLALIQNQILQDELLQNPPE